MLCVWDMTCDPLIPNMFYPARFQLILPRTWDTTRRAMLRAWRFYAINDHPL